MASKSMANPGGGPNGMSIQPPGTASVQRKASSPTEKQPSPQPTIEPIQRQSSASSSGAVVQRFPWGKSIAGVAGAVGLGLMFTNPLAALVGGLLGGAAGHWYDTKPQAPQGPAPQRPNNMTDTQVPFPEDIADHTDRLAPNTTYNQLSNMEQQFLGINVNQDQMTSRLHPQTLNDLGMGLGALTGQADDGRGQTKMSPQGQAHDAYELQRLIYEGATAGASKTHENHQHQTEILGELHHQPNHRLALANDVQQGTAKDTLYLELNQEIQPLVNHYQQQYAQDNTFQMPALLRGYLRRLDANFRTRNPQYPGQAQAGTYEHLVDAYVRSGRRVVFADSPFAKGIPHNSNFEHDREASMNQAMYENIVADQAQNASSYTVLTGQAHVGNNRHGLHTITGLKDRLGIA